MSSSTLTSPSLSPSSSIATSTASCTTVTPDRNGYVPVSACNAQWAYSPSFPAAIAFSILFGVLTLAHLLIAVAFRKPFCWVIIMASAWETAAFILRTVGSRDQQNEGYATASQILFLLAPLWINAFVYMTAGRLIYFLHPEKKVWYFKAVSLGKWFVWLDIFSFAVQAAGGLMLNPGNDAKAQDIGKKIYMSGVGVQEFFILVFFGLIAKFHLDMLRLERQGSLSLESGKRWQMWKWLTYALYAVLALITMRIVFRLAEFSGGMEPETNSLPFKEGYALGLDAFPMVLAVFVLAVVHPGLVLRGEESEFPSRKTRKAEKKEIKRANRERKRARKEAKLGLELDERDAGLSLRSNEHY